MKKMGLGRGLDALLPDMEDTDTAAGGVTTVSINEIDTNPDQPRKTFSPESLAQLAESIKSAGILQPILVVQKNGRYQIAAGERRFRAARLAGLREVPVLVRDLSENELMEIALIENLQREDLNPIEEAEAIKALMDKCGYTQETAAGRLGKSRPAVANALRLLNLPKSIRQSVQDGSLSAGHARVLCGVSDPERQMQLMQAVLEEGLSVRALEALAAQAPEKQQEHSRNEKKPISLELKDMQERLRHVFGVKTVISGNDVHGKITLQYNSPEELDAVYSLLERLEG